MQKTYSYNTTEYMKSNLFREYTKHNFENTNTYHLMLTLNTRLNNSLKKKKNSKHDIVKD